MKSLPKPWLTWICQLLMLEKLLEHFLGVWAWAIQSWISRLINWGATEEIILTCSWRPGFPYCCFQPAVCSHIMLMSLLSLSVYLSKNTYLTMLPWGLNKTVVVQMPTVTDTKCLMQTRGAICVRGARHYWGIYKRKRRHEPFKKIVAKYTNIKFTILFLSVRFSSVRCILIIV